MASKKLMDFVKESDFQDLTGLAFASGIELSVLEEISDGTVLPSEEHVRVIQRFLPKIPRSCLVKHSRRMPKGLVNTPRGKTPENCEFMTQQAEDVLVGDYLAYDPGGGRTGSWWAEVTSRKSVNPQVVQIRCHDIVFQCHIGKPVVSARPQPSE